MIKSSINSYDDFPLPMPENQPLPDEPHYKLCNNKAELLKTYKHILYREPDSGDVENLGRYMFDTLIGRSAWETILQAAQSNPDHVVELALALPHSAGNLYRLNWEMMCAPEGFLVAGYQKEIAITRLVYGPAQMLRPLNALPRVLFVIGASRNEPTIRFGIEYLDLLRHLAREERGIHSRLLEHATPKQIGAMMSSFRPDVVHFICHGSYDDLTGQGYLHLRSKQDSTATERFSAGQLLECLCVGADYPVIVVLSACYSGTIMGTKETAPLACELVRGGVPVVVSMGGRVADRACRLFTTRFGEALLQGESIVVATAEARRAAFAQGSPPNESADWGLPNLFLSEHVPADYAPKPAPDISLLNRRISSYDVVREPVFCGRDEFFDAYHELFVPDKPYVLAIYTEEKVVRDEKTRLLYGKTRLLKELTAEAIRNGHVPCLVSEERPDWEPPTDLAALRREMWQALLNARSAFDLDPTAKSQLFLLNKSIDQLQTDLDFDPLIRNQLIIRNKITDKVIQLALQHDLTALITDARSSDPAVREVGGHAIVLLDDIHRYNEALQPLLYGLLGSFGMGTKNNPVPVILTFSLGSSTDAILRAFMDTGASKTWVKFLQLQEFDLNEDMLVYETILLHPFIQLADTVSHLRWAMDYGLKNKDIIKKWEDRFRKRLKRLPVDFFNEMLYVLAEYAQDDKFVIEANDEKILRKMRGQA